MAAGRVAVARAVLEREGAGARVVVARAVLKSLIAAGRVVGARRIGRERLNTAGRVVAARRVREERLGTVGRVGFPPVFDPNALKPLAVLLTPVIKVPGVLSGKKLSVPKLWINCSPFWLIHPHWPRSSSREIQIPVSGDRPG
jgi:hypothetical protein